jgi:ABC-type glycerol-3-phosphate transport system substrate-binding protein
MVDKYNMKDLIARFEQAHPKVKVKLLTHEGLGAAYQRVFLEWAQTNKSTADLYFGGLVSQLTIPMIDDLLLPWDDMMTGELAPDKWIKAFLQSAWVAGPKGSNYPTLPGLGETMNFQANTDYLKVIEGTDAQGNPIQPTSYKQILDLACKLAATPIQGKKITGFEGRIRPQFRSPTRGRRRWWPRRGTYLLPDGKVNWDSKAGREWMAWQKGRSWTGSAGHASPSRTTTAPATASRQGQVAIINASNSRSTENSNALNKKNVVRMFGYPGKGGVIAFSHQIYIPRVAASPKLARAFAREPSLARHGQTWSAEKFGRCRPSGPTTTLSPRTTRTSPSCAVSSPGRAWGSGAIATDRRCGRPTWTISRST